MAKKATFSLSLEAIDHIKKLSFRSYKSRSRYLNDLILSQKLPYNQFDATVESLEKEGVLKPERSARTTDDEIAEANERLKKKREAAKKTKIPGAAKAASDMKEALNNFMPYSKEAQLGKGGKK